MPFVPKHVECIEIVTEVNINANESVGESVVNFDQEDLHLIPPTSAEHHYQISTSDIGLWPKKIKQADIDHLSEIGPADLRNCDAELFESKSLVQTDGGVTRKCKVSFFVRQNKINETIDRNWLCFSPSQGKLYCFVCKLVSGSGTQLGGDGFADWKHPNRLKDHEESKDHLESVVKLAALKKHSERIDSELLAQAKQIESYWGSVLTRVVRVLKFICERGLAIRGHNEIIGSVHNGNFLGLIELVAEYDPFLKNHIENHANKGSGHVSYLSSTIVEELIEEMGEHVLDTIISRIKSSKYYSVSIDSTPDVSHTDQLTLIFRYIEATCPVERFVTFFANPGHKAEDMFNVLMDFLSKYDISVDNCRGQSYDNASAMSGRYNGLQARVMNVNPLAFWIPCAGHSLNLVGKDAADCSPISVGFFDFLENLYVFFSASTKRHSLLSENMKQSESSVLLPQRISDTRWSSRADATKAFISCYSVIKNTLDQFLGCFGMIYWRELTKQIIQFKILELIS